MCGTEIAGFYVQKCTVCDFQNVKSAQFSDMTYTGKFRTVNSLENIIKIIYTIGRLSKKNLITKNRKIQLTNIGENGVKIIKILQKIDVGSLKAK